MVAIARQWIALAGIHLACLLFGPSAVAQPVHLFPPTAQMEPDQTLRFGAWLEDTEQKDQPAWTWMLVEEDGQTPAPPQLGRVDPDGTYHAPRVFLEPARRVWVKATDSRHGHSGLALVRIVSPELRTTLAKVLGTGWRGVRVDPLAGPSVAQDPDRFAAWRRLPPHHPDRPDFPFRALTAVAFVPRIPTENGLLQDQWVVADGLSVRLISRTGSVRTLFDMGWSQRFRYTKIVVQPWRGVEDGPWEAFLLDNEGVVWRVDAQGGITRRLDDPDRKESWDPVAVPRQVDLAVDRAGNLYLAENTGRIADQRIRRIAPDGSDVVLAVGGDWGRPAGQSGPGPRFHQITCMTLDEAGQCLYLVDDRLAILRVALRDGAVTRVLKVWSLARPRLITGLALHQGLLLASCTCRGHVEFLLVDPATGREAKVFADPVPDRPTTLHLTFGPYPGPAPGKKGAHGTVGTHFHGQFAVADDGRVCLRASDTDTALLLLDWRLPGGAAPADTGKETKGATETKEKKE